MKIFPCILVVSALMLSLASCAWNDDAHYYGRGFAGDHYYPGMYWNGDPYRSYWGRGDFYGRKDAWRYEKHRDRRPEFKHKDGPRYGRDRGPGFRPGHRPPGPRPEYGGDRPHRPRHMRPPEKRREHSSISGERRHRPGIERPHGPRVERGARSGPPRHRGGPPSRGGRGGPRR